MKIRISILALLIVLSNCLYAQHEDLIEQLVASKLVVDQQAVIINSSIKKGIPLTGAILAAINEAAKDRLILRDQAYDIFKRNFYLVQKRIKKDFSINDEELKELMSSLSLALTLYDTTLYTFYKFHDNPKMRRLLNEKDSAYHREGNTFEKSVKGVFSFKNSIYLQRAIKLYDKFFIEQTPEYVDSELAHSHQIIQSSFLYSDFKSRKTSGALRDFFHILGSRIKINFKAKEDFFNFLANSVLYNGSRLFGNIVGKIQKRKGLLYRDENFLTIVGEALMPMDILLEKTPFRLTDNFIPGFWGHAAIYLGTQEDLEELGIWDNELVQQYKKEISKGRFIVEALRDKVQLNTLEHFSDIDDFALLRSREPMTKKELAEHILRALSHVGKKYDFSFDVETGDKIVCSELHYLTFIDVDFQTTIYLGRSTISVDQVAEQGLSNMPFYPVLMYLKGKGVEGERIQETFDSLLEQSIDERIPMEVKIEAA